VLVSGGGVSDREGLGDADPVSSGTSGERVGLGNVRVGDCDVVATGRSTDPCPSFAPHAHKRNGAITNRAAQRAARRGMRTSSRRGQVRPTMPLPWRPDLTPGE
jgi:hypothetical protein